MGQRHGRAETGHPGREGRRGEGEGEGEGGGEGRGGGRERGWIMGGGREGGTRGREREREREGGRLIIIIIDRVTLTLSSGELLTL